MSAVQRFISSGRLATSSISKLTTQISSGELSPAALLAESRERISAIRPLNVYITETNEKKKETKTSAETSPPAVSANTSSKTLMGIPFAIKDNYCTQDIQTTCASHMLENFTPAYTATAVQKLLDAGAVLMGKTNMDEFAMGSGSVDSIFGPVRNPWNSDCIAGGSSGGSAVAVATSSVAFALGSDTGGSVRNPASYCGVVGFKPSYGSVSRHGLISLLNSTDVPSIFAKGVSDARIVYEVIAGHDPKDSTTFTTPLPKQKKADIIKNLRVGIPKEMVLPESGSHLHLYRAVAQHFEDLGADVRQISLPHAEYANACYAVLCCCDVASNMARYDGIEFGHRSENDTEFGHRSENDIDFDHTNKNDIDFGHLSQNAFSGSDALYAASRHEGLNEVVRGRILAGNYFLLKRNYEKYFLNAAKIRRLISEDFLRVFSDEVDVILTPVTLGDAPLLEDFLKMDNRTQQEMMDLFTVGASLAGLPAVSVPAGFTQPVMPAGVPVNVPAGFTQHMMPAGVPVSVPAGFTQHGMPVGMQLIAPFRQDLFLLDVAEVLESFASGQNKSKK